MSPCVCFAEYGVDAIAVRDATRAAYVNLGAINYHFGSKEHLIREAFETLPGPLQKASDWPFWTISGCKPENVLLERDEEKYEAVFRPHPAPTC
ncbi:TetR/AcrR family transcriptional regulator [Chelativorans alearense]|uniref:TetR/AcrR family transcriptional regulator n=1 Tax=Chelativorans alearense TaxID=2681495 RepID=UPI0013D7464B|nr:TetR/AcrR family transcriptional regulator [Chelativorans alearense]